MKERQAYIRGIKDTALVLTVFTGTLVSLIAFIVKAQIFVF